MKRHPTDEALLSYCESREDSESHSEMRAHLEADACERCKAKLALYREILSSLAGPRLAMAPEQWVRTALGCVRELEQSLAQTGASIRETVQGTARKAARRIAETLEEIRMGLVLDSRLGMALPGIRGASTLSPRQLLYESARGNVHLQIESTSSGKIEILGQLIPADGSVVSGKGRAVLLRDEKKTTRALSPVGEFRFEGVAPGRVCITVDWNGLCFLIDEIDL